MERAEISKSRPNAIVLQVFLCICGLYQENGSRIRRKPIGMWRG